MNTEWIDKSGLEEIIYNAIGTLSIDNQLTKLEQTSKQDGILFLMKKVGIIIEADCSETLDLHLVRFQAKKIEGRWMFREIK